MTAPSPLDVELLRREVDRLLVQGDDVEVILPRLAKLARDAEPRSDAWIFAHRTLATLGAPRDPWRASILARRVIAVRPDDHEAWAALGLASSLLGHYKHAASAYERAIDLAPHNPRYAHNLGHLYDAALDRPRDALPLLAFASAAEPDQPDVVASYAHALARAGKLTEARRALTKAARRGGGKDHAQLSRWIEAGAPDVWPLDEGASG